MSVDRLKKIGSRVNGPILENYGPRADAHAIAMHNIVKHKLSIPTEDDNVFSATEMEKGGHKNREADVQKSTSDSADVNPTNLPPVTDANDKTASAKVAKMFHSLATRRGQVQAKMSGGDDSTETATKLMSIHARLHNVKGLQNTIKTFEDNN